MDVKEKNSKDPITGEMNIGEVVARYPETAEVMMGYGLHCVGCHVNPYETIKDGASLHGMSEETIEGMIDEMNETVDGVEKDINLSEPALKKFSDLMKEEKKTGWGLKLTIEKKGCCKKSYEIDFAEKPEENEKEITEKGMKVFVSKNDFPLVKGVRIDYTDGVNGGGFRISNPNKKECTCEEHQ